MSTELANTFQLGFGVGFGCGATLYAALFIYTAVRRALNLAGDN